LTHAVTPANAGVQDCFKALDSGFRRMTMQERTDLKSVEKVVNLAFNMNVSLCIRSDFGSPGLHQQEGVKLSAQCEWEPFSKRLQPPPSLAE
jgi:hypothetical protein